MNIRYIEKGNTMKTLIKNGNVINVFLDEIVEQDVLIENDHIISVGKIEDNDVDNVIDAKGKYICPGFIDGHIHIESSMLQPEEFVRVCLPHGTTTVVADPHEIANVSGLSGVEYMLEATEGLPMNVLYVMPSCVPATSLDEAGAIITSKEIATFYNHPRMLGLGEVMDYPGVVYGNKDLIDKIEITKKAGKIVNGHAPMLNGPDLDCYIASGISDDHECTSFEEAVTKLGKSQWIMIRQGTAARNLDSLINLFDEPYSRRCLLVTDDKHPADLLEAGHIDSIIRQAVEKNKPVLTGIRMATIQAAEHFGLKNIGAIAPGYEADILILNDLDSVSVEDVFYKGKQVVNNGTVQEFKSKEISSQLRNKVYNSFNLGELSSKDFYIEPKGDCCRVIQVIPNELLTNEVTMKLDFSNANGIDIDNDVLKLAVIERHHNTGHIGLGFINGMGLKKGAVASSVSHDSHNLIVVGTNENDMALAANTIRKIGGGLAVVLDGKVISTLPLPIGGLMGDKSAFEMAKLNEEVRKAADELGHSKGIEPFMNLAFVSLPVIPNIKMSTLGLVDVNNQKLLSLFV